MAKQVPPALIIAVIVVILGIVGFVGYKTLVPQTVHVAPGTKIPPMPPRPHQ